MNTSFLIAAGGLLAALASPLIAYIVAARRMSGRVATSDATELWKESSEIRKDYRERLRQADEELRLLRNRVQELSVENAALRARQELMERQLKRLDGAINGD